MKFPILKDFKIHDKVPRHEIPRELIWKGHLELPTGWLYGTPVFLIFADGDKYDKEKKEADKNYYLFKVEDDAKKYELVMVDENWDKINKQANTWQDEYREAHPDIFPKFY